MIKWRSLLVELAEALLAVPWCARRKSRDLVCRALKRRSRVEKAAELIAEFFWVLCKSGGTMARLVREIERWWEGRKKRVRTERGRERG